MPKIRRTKLPPLLLNHLLERVRDRKITPENLQQLYRWLATDPTVPARPWFKRFPSFTLCGEGELIKTFLLPGQLPHGEEIL